MARSISRSKIAVVADETRKPTNGTTMATQYANRGCPPAGTTVGRIGCSTLRGSIRAECGHMPCIAVTGIAEIKRPPVAGVAIPMRATCRLPKAPRIARPPNVHVRGPVAMRSVDGPRTPIRSDVPAMRGSVRIIGTDSLRSGGPLEMIRVARAVGATTAVVFLALAWGMPAAAQTASESPAAPAPSVVATVPADQLLFPDKLVICSDLPYPPQEYFDD